MPVEVPCAGEMLYLSAAMYCSCGENQFATYSAYSSDIAIHFHLCRSKPEKKTEFAQVGKGRGEEK